MQQYVELYIVLTHHQIVEQLLNEDRKLNFCNTYCTLYENVNLVNMAKFSKAIKALKLTYVACQSTLHVAHLLVK